MSPGLDDVETYDRFIVAYDDGGLNHFSTEAHAKRAARRYNSVYGPQQARVYERVAYKFMELNLDD